MPILTEPKKPIILGAIIGLFLTFLILTLFQIGLSIYYDKQNDKIKPIGDNLSKMYAEYAQIYKFDLTNKQDSSAKT